MHQAEPVTEPITPQWTDHNSSDPGITLLEVLLWLVSALAVVPRWQR